MGAFKEPHGGVLKELYLGESAAEQEKQKARDYKSWDLTERQLCDLELLLNGAFSPLEGFLNKDDYESVLRDIRLKSGVIWPIPITLDVGQSFADQLKAGETIALRDQEGVLIATLEIGDIWTPTRRKGQRRYGVTSAIPASTTCSTPRAQLCRRPAERHEPPTHYDFKAWRDFDQLRGRFCARLAQGRRFPDPQPCTAPTRN